MPWILEENCVGCGICIEKCPVEAIKLKNDKAKIYLDKCIRCGTCHDVCPQKAVRHDKEKIPDIVKTNVENVKYAIKKCEEIFKAKTASLECLNRWLKHFNREKIIIEETMKKLKELKNNLKSEKIL